MATIQTLARVWQAAAQLGSEDAGARQQHMTMLYEAGRASLTALRWASRRGGKPRVQFAAAVVLHRLGDASGMDVLVSALVWHLPNLPEIGPELEWAFLEIGAPAATNALIAVWDNLPPKSQSYAARQCICRVWMRLRDPRALEPLVAYAHLIAPLFEQTVPAFGDMAVPFLEQMARDGDPFRRRLVVATLRHIATPHSFTALSLLLQDADPTVRALVPGALEPISAPLARQAVLVALEAGYSTGEAVAMLTGVFTSPQEAVRVYEALRHLVARWEPRCPLPGDSEDAVQTAVPLLRRAPWSPTRNVELLCALLDREPSPNLAPVVAKTLGELLPLALHPLAAPVASTESVSPADWNMRAHQTLLLLLARPDGDTRQEAATALLRFHDRLGVELQEMLRECWPSGRLVDRLQTWLKGGVEASQVANQTMQQVTQWITRVGKDAVDKLTSGPSLPPANGALGLAAPSDFRLLQCLPLLLSNTLAQFGLARTPSDREALCTLGAAAIRALCRLDAAGLGAARASLETALVLTSGAEGDSAWMVRVEASQGLIQLLGADSFPLFCGALEAHEAPVQATAIAALGRLGEPRALPLIAPFAVEGNRHRAVANWALGLIRRQNPETMTLLRGASAADVANEMLLRASSDAPHDSGDTLLRPQP